MTARCDDQGAHLRVTDNGSELGGAEESFGLTGLRERVGWPTGGGPAQLDQGTTVRGWSGTQAHV